MWRIYNDLHTLPRMEYSTRNKQRNSEKIQRKKLWKETYTQRGEKMGFENEQQYNNTSETARARQLKLVDGSTDTLKGSTLLAQVIYIPTLIVIVEKQMD